MPKSISIVAYYSFLIFYFNTTEPTAYMMLFSLIFELVLVVLIFAAFTRFNSENKAPYSASNIVMGGAAVIFVQLFVATIISSSLNEYTETEGAGFLNFSDPLKTFRSEILVIMLVLTITYAYNIYDYLIKKNPIVLIEKSFIYQVLLISGTGLFGIIVLSVFENPNKAIILTLMASGRIVLEFLLNRKIKNLNT